MMDKINQIEAQSKNPKKRVLFVITQSEFGGAQRFLYELATRLNPEKYEILVASGKEPSSAEATKGNKQKDEFLKSLEEKNIKTKKLRFLKRKINPIFDCLGIMELMKLINNFKPDYLHLNSSKAGFLGSAAGFTIKILRFKKFKNQSTQNNLSARPSSQLVESSGLKIIYRIGGWSFNDPWPWWKKKTFIMAEKITAKLKDIIVVNNKSDYEQALKLKIKPKKELKLIYNGIDALKIDLLSKEEARLNLFKNLVKKYSKIFQTDFIIGTIANFYPTKGLEYLIEAIRILNTKYKILNTKYFIIGDGQERKNLESKIMEYGLEKDALLLGQISEAYKYLKAFDIFVLPSVKEGFPWVILEAMAAKVPIVATSVGAMPEIIENGKNGILVEPKNQRQLAEAIKYLIENERIRDEFGIQAHQTVLFKFPIEKMVNQIEGLL